MQKQGQDGAWLRPIGRCSSWSRISKEQKQQGRNSKSSCRKKVGRPLHRLHWLVSESLCLICRACPDGRMVWKWLWMEIRNWSVEEDPAQRSRIAVDQQLLPSSNGYDHWGRPWTYMGYPDEGLQVFMKVSTGRHGRHIGRLFRRRTSLPAAGSGNTKRKQHLDRHQPPDRRVDYTSPAICGKKRCRWLIIGRWRQPDAWRLGSEFTDYF